MCHILPLAAFGMAFVILQGPAGVALAAAIIIA
jgi:hypothetical protein